MAIFLVIPTTDPSTVKESLSGLREKDDLNFYELPRGEFIVSYKGTSQELSNLVGISDGAVTNAIVASVSSYYGRASTDIWEWVKAHWES